MQSRQSLNKNMFIGALYFYHYMCNESRGELLDGERGARGQCMGVNCTGIMIIHVRTKCHNETYYFIT